MKITGHVTSIAFIMSFGFSVGDILAGAELAYKLCKSLSDTKGASSDYQELIAHLNIVHKVLIEVDKLQGANQFAQATINAILFTVNSTNEAIETFLTQYETYEESLRQGGSGNIFKDVYKKGKWATQMPDKVRDLKGTLSTLLAAINCLVSMACYYNAGYDATRMAMLDPDWRPHGTNWGKDIELTARICVDSYNPTKCPGFDEQDAPESFFRPGQIFSAQITSSLQERNDRGRYESFNPRKPPRPENMEDAVKKLAQIRNLPLERMVQYCDDIPHDSSQVICLLCRIKLRAQDARQDATPCPKDYWAGNHFRIIHWEYYFSMRPLDASKYLMSDLKGLILPENRTRPILGSTFSKETWIDLTHISDVTPIETEFAVTNKINCTSVSWHYLTGPVLIRRFVVVRQGVGKCLCLGIHTYSRRGCGDQSDQELFGILHSSEESPPHMTNETGMILAPIRMKSDHPSKALPRTARIHYGRVYEIPHNLPVESIGLVHDASMEVLHDQFEANMPTRRYKRGGTTHNQIPHHLPSEFIEPIQSISTDILCDQLEENISTRRDERDSTTHNQIPQSQIEAANLDTAKAIREDIATVLGSKMSPADYLSPRRK
ncbi:hypothetical protein F4813DRAFT_351563 [Daldinia decipiens]|uniref:uncharacterized protein n=1 Tax=Daldinia decipiens TaxID=326647 RepID=UPI0020C1CB1C|nr:uncharacterized protein F4813DRAFT_351563 [Daldinia decipiens]KAI1660283.1 hypothetical protein F4813DRAFT_351563 [Daldinia decipiens]